MYYITITITINYMASSHTILKGGLPFKALHILVSTEFVKMLLILFSVTLLLTTTVANEGLLQTEAAEQSHQQVSSVKNEHLIFLF